MNKELFIRDLRRFLADLPEEERNAAIQYYEDYFNDAGPEREQQVIEELGSPVEIARQIKRTNQEAIQYGEGSAPNHAAAYPEPARTSSSENRQQHTGGTSHGQSTASQGGQTAAGAGNYSWNNTTAGANGTGSWNNAAAGANGAGGWNNSTAGANGAGGWNNTTAGANTSGAWYNADSPGKIVLIILLCIFAIPIGIPVLCMIFGLIVALLAVIGSLFITIFAVGIALFFSGIVTAAVSTALFPTGNVASGILGLGIGLILLSLGGWIVWAGVLLCGKALPAIIRGIGHGIKSLRKGGN